MAKVKKNPLAGKLGKAFSKHANDETDYGTEFANLPPGISGGIAQFTEGKFGEYKSGTNQGEMFCRLAGVVVSPKEFPYRKRSFENGKIVTDPALIVRVVGLQTSIMIPLCQTKNAKGEYTEVDEHAARLMNELRKLGAEEMDIPEDDDEAMEAIQEVMDGLAEEGVYFKFSTSAGTPTQEYPTERTWENWYGNKGLEDYAPDDAEDNEVVEADDEEAEAEEEEAEEEEVEEEESEEETEEEVEEEVEEEEAEEEEEHDNEALAKLADAWEKKGRKGPGADAAEALTERATGCGLDPDEYPTWKKLAEAIEGAGKSTEDDEEEEEAEEEGEEESAPPAKGDVGMFKPKGAKKAVEVEIMSVNKKDQTCSVKRLDDGKLFKGIEWDRIAYD